jgi:O-antigen/teichoic acid export membrane protein
MSAEAKPSLSQKGGRALSWTFLGTMIRAFIQFALLIILTRLLMPEDFGVMAVAEASVFMACIFSRMGVGPFLIQQDQIGEHQIAAAFTISLMSSALFAAVLGMMSGYIEAFFNMDGLGMIILVMSPSVFLMTMAAVPESLLMRQLEFRAVTLTDLAAYAIGYGIIGLLLALNDAGVWALVLAFVAQDLIRAAAMFSLQPPPRRLFVNATVFREFMAFGGGIMLGSIFNQLAQQIDRFVAGRYLGAADLGFYARAHQLLILPASLFGKVVERVLFPVLSSIQGEEQRLANAFLRATATTALLTMPFSVVVCILAPEIVRLLFGAGWSAAVQPLQWLSLAIMFRISYKISDSLARAKAAVYRRAWRQFIFAVMMLLGSLIGSKYYGLTGVAIGTSIAVTINYFLMTDLSCRIIILPYHKVLQSLYPAMSLTVLIAISSYVSSLVLRNILDSDLFVVMGVFVISGLIALFSMWNLPKFFLGPDGYWTYQIMRKNFTLRA